VLLLPDIHWKFAVGTLNSMWKNEIFWRRFEYLGSDCVLGGVIHDISKDHGAFIFKGTMILCNVGKYLASDASHRRRLRSSTTPMKERHISDILLLDYRIPGHGICNHGFKEILLGCLAADGSKGIGNKWKSLISLPTGGSTNAEHDKLNEGMMCCS
jgi:hypothetical protein